MDARRAARLFAGRRQVKPVNRAVVSYVSFYKKQIVVIIRSVELLKTYKSARRMNGFELIERWGKVLRFNGENHGKRYSPKSYGFHHVVKRNCPFYSTGSTSITSPHSNSSRARRAAAGGGVFAMGYSRRAHLFAVLKGAMGGLDALCPTERRPRGFPFLSKFRAAYWSRIIWRIVSSSSRVSRFSRMRSSTVFTLYMTVVWSRPPKLFPIWAYGSSSSVRERYMATCRA